MMLSLTCNTCGSKFETLEIPFRGEVCFKCHLQNVGFKYTWGKEDFHGPTVRQRQQEQVEVARNAGLDPVPVPVRQELI